MRTWKKGALAGVLALILAGGTYALGRDQGATSNITPPASPTATTSTAGPAPVESLCALQGTSGTPTALPVRWQDVGGWSLPISTTDGPGRRSPTGPWSCYSHTPSGAVLAGIVIGFRADGVAENWQAVVKAQTVPGPAQAAKLATTPSTTRETVAVRGFNVAAYTSSAATIAYYLHTSTAEVTCTTNVVWLDRDWKIQLQDDGSSLSGCTQGVPPSFVPWGPA